MAFSFGKGMNRAAAVMIMSRPANGAFAFAAVWLGAFVGGNDFCYYDPKLLAFSTATVLILSAGNGINDFFDLQIDRINRPARPLPSGRISRKSAAMIFTVMMVVGVALAFTAGSALGLVAIFAGLTLFFYSIKLKAVPLLGNTAVGLLTALTFISGGMIAGGVREAAVPAVFAFLFTVSRELFKDIQDMPGDKALGIGTAPLVWGIRPAWNLASGFLAAGVVYSPIPWLIQGYNLIYLVIMLAGVDVMLIYGVAKLGKTPHPESARKMQQLLKYTIIIGFAAIFLGRPSILS
jgi:geranylgeranylglycerol-phosphate geranylgeranyltransferase